MALSSYFGFQEDFRGEVTGIWLKIGGPIPKAQLVLWWSASPPQGPGLRLERALSIARAFSGPLEESLEITRSAGRALSFRPGPRGSLAGSADLSHAFKHPTRGPRGKDSGSVKTQDVASSVRS